MQLTARFDDALRYAHDAHRTQLRKGTSVPYIAHLIDVAAIVLMYGGDEDQAIAALLHDAPEDCGGRATLDDIRDRFGADVADIVEGCTDTFETPKPAWLARKRDYIAHVADPLTPARTLFVSAADKLANTRAILADWRVIGDAVFDRFSGGRDGTLWYYRALVTVFRARAERSIDALVDEFDRVVSELQRVTRTSAPT